MSEPFEAEPKPTLITASDEPAIPMPAIRPSRFQRWGWEGFLLLASLTWLFYVVVTPLVMQQYHHHFRPGKVMPAWLEHPFSVMLLIRTMELLAILWFFGLGAAVGSFLNVVAWRLPRGRGVVFGSSACPNCQHPIRASDNLPLVGWLRLRGVCRVCRSPIPSRYVLAEILLGGIFLWFLIVQLLSGGWNLPFRPANSYAGVLWILWFTKWDLVAYYTFHMLLFSSLFVLLFMEREGLGIPGRCRSLMIGLGCLFLFAMPWVQLVTLTAPWLRQANTYVTMASGLVAGAIAGPCIGWMLKRIFFISAETADPKTFSQAWFTGWLLIGIILGWQASVGIAAIWCLIMVFSRLLWRRSVSWMAILLIATIVHHTFWRFCIEW